MTTKVNLPIIWIGVDDLNTDDVEGIRQAIVRVVRNTQYDVATGTARHIQLALYRQLGTEECLTLEQQLREIFNNESHFHHRPALDMFMVDHNQGPVGKSCTVSMIFTF